MQNNVFDGSKFFLKFCFANSKEKSKKIKVMKKIKLTTEQSMKNMYFDIKTQCFGSEIRPDPLFFPGSFKK